MDVNCALYLLQLSSAKWKNWHLKQWRKTKKTWRDRFLINSIFLKFITDYETFAILSRKYIKCCLKMGLKRNFIFWYYKIFVKKWRSAPVNCIGTLMQCWSEAKNCRRELTAKLLYVVEKNPPSMNKETSRYILSSNILKICSEKPCTISFCLKQSEIVSTT